MKKKFIIPTIAVLVIIFLALGRLFFGFGHQQSRAWLRDSFGGTVESISTSTIVVVNARQDSRTFNLATDTKYFQGRGNINFTDIKVGSLVLVNAPNMDARIVRVLTKNDNVFK